MRVLAIDYGKKRTGLAISDESGIAITNLPQLQTSSPGFFEQLLRIIDEKKPGQAIIGKSLLHETATNNFLEEINNFANRLQKARKNLKVHFVDESYSSMAAEEALHEMLPARSLKARQKKKEKIDSLAAHLMLRQYLESGIRIIE